MCGGEQVLIHTEANKYLLIINSEDVKTSDKRNERKYVELRILTMESNDWTTRLTGCSTQEEISSGTQRRYKQTRAVTTYY